MNSRGGKDASARPAVKSKGTGSEAILTRVISAVVALPPVIAAIYFGSPWFGGLVLLCCGLLVWEWARLCGLASSSGAVFISQVTVLGAVLAATVHRVDLGFIVLAVGLAATGLLSFGGRRLTAAGGGGTGTVWTATGIVYIGMPAMLLVWIRDDLGLVAALWLFALVWATDTGAYAFGRLIGGPKLAPRISPNKTWAGLIGGMICASAVGAGVAHYEGNPAIWGLMALSATLAVAAQCGDLFESWVKRRFHVKDAGSIMPGHGGLLDRVDGLLAAAAIVAAIGHIGGQEGLSWM